MNERDDVLFSTIQASTGNTRSDMLLEMVRAALPGTTKPGRTRAMHTTAVYHFIDVMQEIARYEIANSVTIEAYNELRDYNDHLIARLADAPTVDAYHRLIQLILAGFAPDPGTSDLDNEQPIFVRMTLGDY